MTQSPHLTPLNEEAAESEQEEIRYWCVLFCKHSRVTLKSYDCSAIVFGPDVKTLQKLLIPMRLQIWHHTQYIGTNARKSQSKHTVNINCLLIHNTSVMSLCLLSLCASHKENFRHAATDLYDRLKNDQKFHSVPVSDFLLSTI